MAWNTVFCYFYYMSHANTFEILGPSKTVFRYYLASFDKNTLTKGFYT